MTITPKKLTVHADMIAEFKVPKMVLKLRAQVVADTTIKVKKDRITASLSDLSLDVKVLENNLGHPLSGDDVSKLANELVPLLLPTINSQLATGIPLPKVQHVTFSSPLLLLANRHIQVAVNVS